MEHNFDLSIYKKMNIDLSNLNNEQLINHYNKIGKYQSRIYFQPSFFKKFKVYIFTVKYGYYISNVLKYLLFKNFIISEIITNINHNSSDLHIIPFSQKVKVFPKNYIIYQLEQKDISKWIDKRYEMSILLSNKTWDYSISNIQKFPSIIQKKMIYYPIPLIPYNYINPNININKNPKNNILFYGSMNDIRRIKLNYLQKKLYPKYNIKIINNIFGHQLFEEILNSKIVLNIHFYKDAILETYRLNEILSCNRIVISEMPNMIDVENYNKYLDINNVYFINNIDEMYEKIIYLLESINLNNVKELNNFKELNDFKELNYEIPL